MSAVQPQENFDVIETISLDGEQMEKQVWGLRVRTVLKVFAWHAEARDHNTQIRQKLFEINC